MKSVRLSNSMRQEILNSVCSEYEQQNPCPENLEEKLSLWVYADIHSGVCQSVLKAVDQRYLTHGRKFKVSFAGYQFMVKLPEDKVVFAENAYDVHKVYSDTPVIFLEYQKRLHEIKKWVDEYKDFRREIEQLLASVNTTNQLLSLWPEVQPFFPPYLVDPSKAIKLPTIRTTKFNERLGL